VTERRALVVTTPTAAGPHENGATLRVDDVCAALAEAGLAVTRTTDPTPHGTGWDLGVAVSYATAGSLRTLRRQCTRTWLDAVDSWLLVDGSGLRAGHLSYALRAVRDSARLLTAPRADLVTYISGADLRSDRGTVRGRRRLVLPARVPEAVRPRPSSERRLVLAGDWDYPPNRDGLRWLVRDVMPWLATPVHVYGRGHVPAHPLLVQQGYATDPGELLQEGDVHLAPVRFGGGVKRKVLQPLLAGLPVVATPAAALGLRAHPLLHVAATPLAFAKGVQYSRHPKPSQRQPPVVELFDRDDREAARAWLSGDGRGG
jgi:hypothetical protein